MDSKNIVYITKLLESSQEDNLIIDEMNDWLSKMEWGDQLNLHSHLSMTALKKIYRLIDNIVIELDAKEHILWYYYKKVYVEAGIRKEDVKWLLGAPLVGGVLAPIVLMLSLKNTPASTASLLLNFEGVSTTLIAAVVFKEAIGKRIWLALAAITTSSILLSWNFDGEWGFSIGALGVLFAYILWGLDNNFTRNISAKDPLSIVIIKGIAAGSFSLLLAFMLQHSLPNFKIILSAIFLGFICYGFSIVLFILAMRNLGASRTSAFFGTAPFVGTFLSLLLFDESPNTLFYVSLPIMIVGTVLLLSEKHIHKHIHEPMEHEHRHRHDDGHHTHQHDGETVSEHSHLHKHEAVEHTHPHTPDIHHRHKH